MNAPIKVPQAIWNDMRLGFGEAADKPTVAAAIKVIIAPLGQAVRIQKLPNTRRMNEARSPAASDTIQLVCAT
ncbi:hypothetical protein D3C81_1282440 [compost metagenome]